MATLISSLLTQARRAMLEVTALDTPAIPVVTPQGTTGATTYTYKIVALNANGHSPVSAAGSTTTGNAALSSTNFNRLTWTTVLNATGYSFYRTVGGGSTGLIGSVGEGVALFDDTGLLGDSAVAATTNTSAPPTSFWSDAELLEWAVKACSDLWRALIDLHQEHWMTVDASLVSLAASTATLTGVPADVYRVLLIEPRDTTTTGTAPSVIFRPAKYNSAEFIAARSRSAQDPTNGLTVFYAISGAGSPVAAPTIYAAPLLSSTLTLRFVYIPTLAALTSASTNPIPGESDLAIVAFIVAYASAKGKEDRSPDANWLTVYSTEKKSIEVASTPRQEQEPRYVRGIFDDEDASWN